MTRRALLSRPSNALVGRWLEAAMAAGLSIDMVSYSDFEIGRRRRLPVGARNLTNPLHAVRQLRRSARESRLVFLHEFLTIPFLPWASTLADIARRVVLVVHHNVQRAAKRARDRIGMRILLRLGFRFVAPESAAGFTEVMGEQPEEVLLALPFGLPQQLETRDRTRRIVTVMGGDREEKGDLAAVERVMRAARDRLGEGVARVASRSPAVLERARARGWPALDSSSRESWRTCLVESSVVVVDYPAASYYYRPSATLCDAIAAGAAVVVPNYPVLRAQVRTPCDVGCVLEEGGSIASALEAAMAIGNGPIEPFHRYLEDRGPKSLAEKLGRFLEAQKVGSS